MEHTGYCCPFSMHGVEVGEESMDIDRVENIFMPVKFNTFNLGLESEELEVLMLLFNTLDFKDVSDISFMTNSILAQS